MAESQQYRVVGRRTPYLDAPDKATGRVTYGVDFRLPGMLWGKIVRAPCAHGRIVRLDTTRARNLPGVKAVISGQDVPQHKIGHSVKDQDILCRDRVRYLGEPIALVAAVDEDAAARAAEAVTVEVEELPAVFDVAEALGSDAALVHDDPSLYEPGAMSRMIPIRPVSRSNIASHVVLSKGDVDAAFRGAHAVFEDTFNTHIVQHCHLQPHAVVASFSTTQRLTVWTSHQRVFGVRSYLSEVLDLPLSRIRIIGTEVGGGFGGQVRPVFERFPALLAMKTGKPVKMVLTREEEFVFAYRSVPGVFTIRTAVDRDGGIIGRATTVRWDTGAYAEGLPPIISALSCGAGPYRIPNAKIEVFLVYTNKVPGTSYRGVGMPELTFAIESHTDIIARKLGMDPLEFRLKNIVDEGSETVMGTRLRNVGLRECIEKVRDELEWGKGAPRRGRAIVCFQKFASPISSSSAHVLLNEDGTVRLSTGATEIGQGCKTALAQICAEELGVRLQDIEVTMSDTGATPFDAGAFSSRLTHHAGNAVRQAAAEAKKRILGVAAGELGVAADALDINEGRIFSPARPEIGIPLGQLARKYLARSPGPIQGVGSFSGGLDIVPILEGAERPPEGKEEDDWKFGATGIELELDRDTGQIKARRAVSAHDCGRAINPLAVEGQIEGAFCMGWANSTLEAMWFDGGKVQNPSFMEYLLPTAADAPSVVPLIVERPTRGGPFGAKGIGELANLGVGAAIANALEDLAGVRITSTPITPEKVLRALSDQPNAGGRP